MTGRRALRGVLVGGALLAGTADAHPRPTPAPPQAVGFAQLQRVLTAARTVTAALRAGPVDTTGGQRVVTLTVAGRAVARVAVEPDGTLAPLPGGPAPPHLRPAALTPAGAAHLRAQVAALTVSGAVQATPGEYRVPLLSGGVVVAALRLDRVTLHPRPAGPRR